MKAISTPTARFISLPLIVFTLLINSCNSIPPSGINKDLNTGLVTTYTGLVPSGTKVIMNDQVLNHTDIPLGESFVILNEKVKGFTIKDGKVSVGCALTISDKSGKVLLAEPDLFKEKDIFDKDSLDYLRCTVNTGKPMEWEQNYDVTVVFTDKYGNGKIENKVTIRAIDIP
ncbi:MAG: hypothetical protein JST09_17435 [Bacteroidetes bacterium]|nr:hypothetical protein [Bacteroidota bacterium]MBS1607867.1 hypothetical protein [Bacteroidota bacterium]